MAEDLEDNLFYNGGTSEGSSDSDAEQEAKSKTGSAITKTTGIGSDSNSNSSGEDKNKFRDKLKNSGLINDTITSVDKAANGTLESFKDTLKSKNKRNTATDLTTFKTKEVSNSNRHKDPISSILNDTFNGNIFDAGVSAVNLFNFGSKWTMLLDQYSDKELYPFKYWYYLDSSLSSGSSAASETSNRLGMLDTIEDPTALGYSIKIDSTYSPLFNNKIENFLTDYTPQHGEMALSSSYLQTF